MTKLTLGTAMARAFRAIESSPHLCFKDRIRFALRNPDTASVKARYGARMNFLRNLPVNSALIRVQQWHSLEMRSYQIACAYGRGNRLGLMVLGELRLILRFMRARRLSMQEAA